ncbi:uncharacterized protein TRIADDRAFT_59431 [Trichoplax adhaerens]|uniref:XLR/SYCP3/FAM9 domain-containing protein n=1 Tax=Trichoplax adhaerens TaxID=10228 RepID=B3S5P7_TRIAD|nr:hypothetical protein TRIADDRAFT_59431 [Trichoplax adhaerens]EDV21935.1 hypothetical protein TRIADDRAFT_59431 [Trichoplax adhaerens]|eukprot:XP_002115572.1 hypothetical protein TRIADDRAFT_59431 [Trichoplax adhaerens]
MAELFLDLHRLVNVSKSLNVKQKLLEEFTLSSLSSSKKKVEETWIAHRRDRKELTENFEATVSNIMNSWKEEIQDSKRFEDKVHALLQQHQELLMEVRNLHAKYLTHLHESCKMYVDSISSIDERYEKRLASAHCAIKKEAQGLKKKTLQRMRQQEIAEVRNTLLLKDVLYDV